MARSVYSTSQAVATYETTPCGLQVPKAIEFLGASEADFIITFCGEVTTTIYPYHAIDDDIHILLLREEHILSRVRLARVQWLDYHDKHCDCRKEE